MSKEQEKRKRLEAYQARRTLEYTMKKETEIYMDANGKYMTDRRMIK